MAGISDKCGTQLKKEGVIDQGTFILAWIALREYKRVHGTAADVQAWDVAAAKAWEDEKKNPQKDPTDALAALLDQGAKAFGVSLTAFILSSPVLPGWDNTKCRMDWHAFACFANWASSQTPDQIGQLIISNPTKIPYACADVVKSDPAYDGELPMPGQKKSFFSGWVPWAVGGVAAVGIGTAAVIYYKRNR